MPRSPSTLPLHRLRGDLDFLPSPIPDRPGLLVRDPFRYSEAVVVVPPLLVRCLICFDGEHADADLRNLLSRLTGRADSDEVAVELARALSEAGFLDDHVHAAQRSARWREFAAAPVRRAAFAGGGYPEDAGALRATLRGWMSDDSETDAGSGAPPARDDTRDVGPDVERDVARTVDRDFLGIAAPHVSPSGGVPTYRSAYRALAAIHAPAERTFVLLGTSHYGQPNRFGLTRKAFETPLGRVQTDVALVDEVARAAPATVDMEDYCHAIEHSIEFQILFLQGLFGAGTFKILPVLCGPFAQARGAHARPEDDPGVARALEALGMLQAHHGHRLAWVLGVDLSHVGRRYGQSVQARANDSHMSAVAVRDHARLDRVTAGDADGFWGLVHERAGDDLNWCGSAPLYTFLRAVPESRGQLLHYDQWNIDDASVVSFAALAFSRR